jgi:hypothetical protein
VTERRLPHQKIVEHVELCGRAIRYPEPDRQTRAFMKRAATLAADPHTAPEIVRAVIFGPDNPIMARHPTLSGGYPDARTLRNPLYWVCVDLVLRAEMRANGIPLDGAGRPFTMSIPEAARKLGRYEHAIHNAIENRTLHAWVHEGRSYLLPAEVAAYNVPRRGRPPKPAARPGSTGRQRAKP